MCVSSLRHHHCSIVRADRLDSSFFSPVEWNDSLVHSALGLGPKVNASIPKSLAESFVFCNTLVGFGFRHYVKETLPESSSLWGKRGQAKSLLMIHPGNPWAKDWVGQFLHHSWQGTCGVPAPFLTGHLRGTCTIPDSCLVMEVRRRASYNLGCRTTIG